MFETIKLSDLYLISRCSCAFRDTPLGSQPSNRLLEILLADNVPLLRMCKDHPMGPLSVKTPSPSRYDHLRLIQRVLNIPPSKAIRYGYGLAPVDGGLSGYIPRPVLFEQSQALLWRRWGTISRRGA